MPLDRELRKGWKKERHLIYTVTWPKLGGRTWQVQFSCLTCHMVMAGIDNCLPLLSFGLIPFPSATSSAGVVLRMKWWLLERLGHWWSYPNQVTDFPLPLEHDGSRRPARRIVQLQTQSSFLSTVERQLSVSLAVRISHCTLYSKSLFTPRYKELKVVEWWSSSLIWSLACFLVESLPLGTTEHGRGNKKQIFL